MHPYHKLLIVLAVLLNFNSISSQTGPGGVGGAGTSDLIMWLRADAGVESSSGVFAIDGDNLSNWLDQSGDGNNARSENAPHYETNQHNGYPAVHFTEASDEYMHIDNHTNLPSGNTDRTYIFAAEPSNSANQTLLYHGHTNETLGNEGRRINITNNTNEFSIGISGQRYGINRSVTTDINVGTIILPTSGTNSEDFVNYIDGLTLTSVPVAGITGARNVNTLNQDAWIGGNRNASRHYNGDMCEIIVFDREINDAEFIITHNYISAKYGTSLPSAIDLYTQDNTGNGNFDHNVAGIGQASNGSNHTDSQGTGIVRINNPSALSNGDFLFWGEDTIDSNYDFSTNNAAYYEHLDSSWRVSKTNDLGTVTVSFDISNINLSGNQSCQPLQLVVDNDSDFSSPTIYALSISGSIATATTPVNFSDGDYFSLRYLDQIFWNGTSYFNGSRVDNSPNNSTDSCLKLTVKSGINAILSFDAYVRDVEIEPGATLNIADGILLEVENNVIINGTLELLGEAQLIQNHLNITSNSGTGTLIKRQQGVANLYNYNYWSAPVNNGGTWQIGDLEDNNGLINFTTNENANPTTVPSITLSSEWLYSFNGDADTYSIWDKLTTTSPLDPGIGYTMKGSGTANPEQEYIFKGIPNDGNYSIPITTGDEILIGNPYPSALNVNQFITDNTSSIEGTLYFWEHFTTNNSHFLNEIQGGYAIRNLMMGTAATADASGLTSGVGSASKPIPKQYIPVGQGFFVTAKPSGGNIVFNNGQRFFARESLIESVFYKSNTTKTSTDTNTDQRTKIWFSFTEPSNKIKQLGLGYDVKASKNYDNGYDAKAYDDLRNDINWALDDNLLTIQALSSININDVLPLKTKITDAGIYKFAIDNMQYVPDHLDIYLKDNDLNIYYNIKNQTADIFLDGFSDEDRFSIVFKQDHILSADAIENNSIYTSYNQNSKILELHNTDNIAIDKLTIVNTLGQEVINVKSPQSNTFNIEFLNNGLYIISVNTKKDKKVVKFLKY